MVEQGNWNWADTWLSFLMLLVFLAAALAGRAITADHTIRYYYVDWESASVAPIPCIKAYREWWPDDTVYCAQDTEKITTLFKTLTDTLHQHH